MARVTFIDRINRFDLTDQKTYDNDLTAFGKQAARFVNRRLGALEKAGISSAATTGGVKRIKISRIKSKASAVRAISKARSLLANPLSTPGKVNKLMREAQKEYGQRGRMKIIAVEAPVVDEKGRWVGVKLVPKAVPWGSEKGATPWYRAEQQIKSFWNWYHDELEQWVASEEAQRMWEESRYNAKSAKDAVINDVVKRAEEGIPFSDQISKITKTSEWLK